MSCSMRASRGIVVALLVVSASLLPTSDPAVGQVEQGCGPDRDPMMAEAFAMLQAQLGPIMGSATSCPYVQPGDDAIYLNTSTGLAYQNPAGVVVFTDGYRHWAMTPDSTVYWESTSSTVPANPCSWEPGTGRPTVGAWLGPDQPFWTVIVGSFRSRSDAEALGVKLCLANLSAGVIDSDEYSRLTPGYWVTHSGFFRDRAAGAAESYRLQALGFEDAYPRELRRR